MGFKINPLISLFTRLRGLGSSVVTQKEIEHLINIIATNKGRANEIIIKDNNLTRTMQHLIDNNLISIHYALFITGVPGIGIVSIDDYIVNPNNNEQFYRITWKGVDERFGNHSWEPVENFPSHEYDVVARFLESTSGPRISPALTRPGVKQKNAELEHIQLKQENAELDDNMQINGGSNKRNPQKKSKKIKKRRIRTKIKGRKRRPTRKR